MLGMKSRSAVRPRSLDPPDAAAMRAARGKGPIELAIGETLLRLFDGDRLMQLGFARQSDYARERLGVPVRTVHAWTALARGLATRPVLRGAVVAGRVAPRKALTVMQAATGAREAAWTAAAVDMTLGDLQRCVRAGGFEACSDDYRVESVVLRMTPAQQDRLDRALSLAEAVVGPGTPRWQRLEAICQEWLGEFAGLDPLASLGEVAPLEVRMGLAFPMRRSAQDRPVASDPESAAALDARVRALLARHRGHDEALGRALLDVLEGDLHGAVGYGSFESYVRERLGLSPRSAWQRVWLERRLRRFPALRAALGSGRLTLTKAMLVARRATALDVERRIEQAAESTWQQVERDATREEDLQNRAVGRRRLWGPADAFETITYAIGVVQVSIARARGAVPSEGEALAVMADHFVAVWEVHRPPRRESRARRRVLRRHGGRCAVPGCSAPADHEHHIVFRSRGGSDSESNRVALCAAHHLRGVHRAVLSVSGRAGERLTWRLGGERWTTLGDDDVRTEAPMT